MSLRPDEINCVQLSLRIRHLVTSLEDDHAKQRSQENNMEGTVPENDPHILLHCVLQSGNLAREDEPHPPAVRVGIPGVELDVADDSRLPTLPQMHLQDCIR
jgi:hypothetical protein